MRKRNKALAPAALWRQMKPNRLMLADHDGDLWFTNTYVACRLRGDRFDAVGELLALYNLTPEPMVCRTDGGTLQRQDVEPPDMAALVKKIDKPKEDRPVHRESIGSSPILVERAGKGSLQVWTDGRGLRIYLDPAMVGLVDLLAPEGKWFGRDTPMAPLTKRDGKRAVAVAMPVRHEPLFNAEAAA